MSVNNKQFTPMAAKRYSSTNGHFGPFRILGDTDDQAACDLPWLCPRDSSMAFSVKPRLHDTTCCQRVVKPGLATWLDVCLHDKAGCQSGCTTGFSTGCVV